MFLLITFVKYSNILVNQIHSRLKKNLKYLNINVTEMWYLS
jgi:hypothetical protein